VIVVRYAVCSERRGKPVTRAVVDSRVEADRALEHLRELDLGDLEESYWIAEVGSEAEAWCHLVPEVGEESS
jgi:hypothetical protein